MSVVSASASRRQRVASISAVCCCLLTSLGVASCSAEPPALPLQISSASPYAVSVDAIALHRSDAQSNAFVFDQASTPPQEVVNADQLGSDAGVGSRITLSRELQQGAWEVCFWGIDGWSDSILLPSGDYLLHADATRRGPPSEGPLYLAYRSRLYTTELNWKHALECNWLSPLVGARWLRLGESFGFAGQYGDAPSTEFEGIYRTQNDLFGGQLGAEALLFAPTERLSLSATGKAGAYLNDVQMTVDYTAEGNELSQSNQDESLAFVGEILLTASCKITPSVTVRGGYQLNWIEGAALAANQPSTYVAMPSNGKVNDDGSLFLHGGFAGLEVAW